MNRFTYVRSMAVRILVVTGMAVAYGCSSTPTAKMTVESMTDFGNETAKAKDQIDTTIRSLEKLVATQPSEIKANYDAYSKSVNDLEQQAMVVKANAQKMKIDGDGFFKAWEASSSTTVTPECRADLSASYAKITDDLNSAKDAFVPFLASLKDIQSYLGLDLSVKGINDVAPTVTKAHSDGAVVKSRLDAVLTRVNSVRGMLATTK